MLMPRISGAVVNDIMISGSNAVSVARTLDSSARGSPERGEMTTVGRISGNDCSWTM